MGDVHVQPDGGPYSIGVIKMNTKLNNLVKHFHKLQQQRVRLNAKIEVTKRAILMVSNGNK